MIPRGCHFAWLLVLATTARADNNTSPAVFPTPIPLSRYDDMIRKSPFAPATPAGTPVVATAVGFATNYYVSGVAKIGERDFVTIASRDGQTRFSLMPGEAGPDGITVTRIDWSAEPGKSKVLLKKGSEVGVAEFDQAALAHPVAAAPPVVPSSLPPTPRSFNGLRNPGPLNLAPAPGVRPAPQMPSAPMPGQGNSLDSQNQPQQRRIRIINSRPQ